jgi:hypothetical protein
LSQFDANLELAQHGYNFVFLDGDVYLTGAHDPFSHMLSPSNDTWDIQFQSDNQQRDYELNIGWYFAKSTNATIDFFRRSYARWNNTEGWNVKVDQYDQKVMNLVGQTMEFEEHSLQVHHLKGPQYRVGEPPS